MKLWAMFGRPVVMARFHAIAAFGWLAIAIVGVLVPAISDSVKVIFFISVYANVVGHWSSNQAAKVEVKQDSQIEGAE